MSFRKHLAQQAPHLMLTFGLGLATAFVAFSHYLNSLYF